MTKMKPVDSLRESIRLLEIRQIEERIIVNEQFKLTFESLKPINLFKSSIKELTSSAELKSNIFETVLSILSCYITNKIVVNSKSSTFMKIIGALLQYGITSVVAKNADQIHTYINYLIEKFLHPNKQVPDPEE